MRNLILVFSLVIFLYSCSNDTTPRPWGYHRLILPEHKYKLYDNPNCPYKFEIPVYGQVLNEDNDSCFLDIDFPQFGELVYKHSKKATEIREHILERKNGIGTFFELYGEVPTSAQFFFSDSTRFAMITSMYFKTATKNDSLKPVIDFMKKDLMHLIETIQWK